MRLRKRYSRRTRFRIEKDWDDWRGRLLIEDFLPFTFDGMECWGCCYFQEYLVGLEKRFHCTEGVHKSLRDLPRGPRFLRGCSVRVETV